MDGDDEGSIGNLLEEAELQQGSPQKVNETQDHVQNFIALEGKAPLTFLLGFGLFLNLTMCHSDFDAVSRTIASVFTFQPSR